jgi:glycosyltransferase involved in cell wall biosynthesis
VNGSSRAPVLSVILPNYNHAKLVPRAIAALVEQVPPPDEVIVVDDCSTDDSLDVLNGLAARYPLLRVIPSPANAGVVPAQNRGIEAARGEYLYFGASDDWVAPGFFAEARRMLDAYPDAGLFCGEARLVDGETGETLSVRPPVRPVAASGMVRPEQSKRLLQRIDNWILTGSAVFRRDAFEAAGGLDPALGPFADGFLSRKIAVTRGFCYTPRIVAIWCVFRAGYSRTTALDIRRARDALEALPTRFASDGAFPEWYPKLFADRWRFGTARLAIMAEPIHRDLVLAMGARSSLDHAILKTAMQLPARLARLTSLAWLWFRLRPTTLTGLIRTALARGFEAVASRDRSR